MQEQSPGEARQLVVMRHAKAEPGGETDHERTLTTRGYDDAVEAGRWLAGCGFTPDAALVSAATRTRSTWEALARGGSFDLTAEFSESLYAAGPETALDLVRESAEDVRSLVVIGHNPTMGYLAQLLDDGSGDEAAGTDMASGFPTAAVARFAVSCPWSALELATARLVGFHVGHG